MAWYRKLVPEPEIERQVGTHTPIGLRVPGVVIEPGGDAGAVVCARSVVHESQQEAGKGITRRARRCRTGGLEVGEVEDALHTGVIKRARRQLGAGRAHPAMIRAELPVEIAFDPAQVNAEMVCVIELRAIGL